MFNIETIKQKLNESYDISQKWWIAVSWFENENTLNFCKWVIFSDEKISLNLQRIYTDYILTNKKLKILVIDIITNIQEIKSLDDLKKIDILNEWIFIWDTKNDKGSFILPDTKWIDTIKKTLDIIKSKVEFSSKQVNIYKFKTKRFTLTQWL